MCTIQRILHSPHEQSLILGGIDHTALVSNPDVQKTILDILGHPFKNEDIHTGTWKGWWNILCALIDPVEGVLMDGSGRRLGYTAATGPLTEIPGSLWFGGADGMGWILEPVQQPLSLQLTGLGENYYAMVAADQVTLQGGLVISGTLGLGETLNFPISLLPKNPLYLPLVIK